MLLLVLAVVSVVSGQGVFYDTFQEPFCPYTTCVTVRDFVFQANASMIGPSKVFAVTAYTIGYWADPNLQLCYKLIGTTEFEGCVPNPLYLR